MCARVYILTGSRGVRNEGFAERATAKRQELIACVSRKAVTAVRSEDTDTNDTNRERKAEPRSEQGVMCDAWSQRLGLGVLDVTCHVCDSLVSGSE